MMTLAERNILVGQYHQLRGWRGGSPTCRPPYKKRTRAGRRQFPRATYYLRLAAPPLQQRPRVPLACFLPLSLPGRLLTCPFGLHLSRPVSPEDEGPRAPARGRRPPGPGRHHPRQVRHLDIDFILTKDNGAQTSPNHPAARKK